MSHPSLGFHPGLPESFISATVPSGTRGVFLGPCRFAVCLLPGCCLLGCCLPFWMISFKGTQGSVPDLSDCPHDFFQVFFQMMFPEAFFASMYAKWLPKWSKVAQTAFENGAFWYSGTSVFPFSSKSQKSKTARE